MALCMPYWQAGVSSAQANMLRSGNATRLPANVTSICDLLDRMMPTLEPASYLQRCDTPCEGLTVPACCAGLVFLHEGKVVWEGSTDEFEKQRATNRQAVPHRRSQGTDPVRVKLLRTGLVHGVAGSRTKE